MMNSACDEFLEEVAALPAAALRRLAAQLDGEYSRVASEDELPQEVSNHVRECAFCRTEIAFLADASETLQSLPAPALPRDFAARVQNAIANVAQEVPREYSPNAESATNAEVLSAPQSRTEEVAPAMIVPSPRRDWRARFGLNRGEYSRGTKRRSNLKFAWASGTALTAFALLLATQIQSPRMPQRESADAVRSVQAPASTRAASSAATKSVSPKKDVRRAPSPASAKAPQNIAPPPNITPFPSGSDAAPFASQSAPPVAERAPRQTPPTTAQRAPQAPQDTAVSGAASLLRPNAKQSSATANRKTAPAASGLRARPAPPATGAASALERPLFSGASPRAPQNKGNVASSVTPAPNDAPVAAPDAQQSLTQSRPDARSAITSTRSAPRAEESQRRAPENESLQKSDATDASAREAQRKTPDNASSADAGAQNFAPPPQLRSTARARREHCAFRFLRRRASPARDFASNFRAACDCKTKHPITSCGTAL